MSNTVGEEEKIPRNFITDIIDEDLKEGRTDHVATRFPPEPNGYLHIGHAKSICLNFGLARDYKGTCNLRFDDTNPEKEDMEYINSIQNDVKWLGFKWTKICHSSDYFERLYGYAIELINKGLAYVDELSPDEIREYRGTLTKPGKESPYRNRTVDENLALFEKMKNGEFKEGQACLRAKIDMSSPFICMRDPVIYRIRFAEHAITKDNGAFILCMTLPTVSLMQSKVLPTQSVLLSSKITEDCMIGFQSIFLLKQNPISMR